jgi:SAM-dependent methyltransferase
VRFETIRCPACGSDAYRHHLDVGDRFHTIPGQSFSIVRCDACRLLFVNPRPDADSLAEFYKADAYDPFVSSRETSSLFTRFYTFARGFSVRRKASRVTRGLPPGARTLDVGCATGEFMRELRTRGFQPFGVEPSALAADFARRTHGLTVWDGDVHAVPDSAAPFDLITLWHVLEHIHDLQGSLQRLRELLSENGTLAIAVPNPLSSDARAYGAQWVAWDTPRHLYHFEPPVMIDLLTRAGFKARRQGAVAFDAFYHCLLSERGTAAGYLRAGLRGSRSYILGLAGREGSSELYLATKR